MSHFPVWVFTESGTETEIDDCPAEWRVAGTRQNGLVGRIECI